MLRCLDSNNIGGYLSCDNEKLLISAIHILDVWTKVVSLLDFLILDQADLEMIAGAVKVCLLSSTKLQHTGIYTGIYAYICAKYIYPPRGEVHIHDKIQHACWHACCWAQHCWLSMMRAPLKHLGRRRIAFKDFP